MTALVLSLLLAQEWEYRQGTGFVDLSTMTQKSPEDFVKHCLAQREEGNHVAAISGLSLALASVQEPALRETVHFERAGSYYRAGLYYEAYQDYESFIVRFPQSDRSTAAKRLEMASALELARAGKSGFLGISAGSKAGVDALRDALRRYPREDSSSDFTQKLGMFFFERREWDLASEEFSRVLDQYGDQPDAVLALYMLGRTAEMRFDALDYDARPLKDARRFYERFLDETEKMRRLPGDARKWVDGLLPAVRERLAGVYDRLLRKVLQVADYYDWKDAPRSARLYYQSILREEAAFRRVLPTYPETEAAKKARRRLAELAP